MDFVQKFQRTCFTEQPVYLGGKNPNSLEMLISIFSVSENLSQKYN